MSNFQNFLAVYIAFLIFSLLFILCTYASNPNFDQKIQIRILKQRSDRNPIKKKNFIYRIFKRLLDLLFGIIGAFTILPLVICISIAIKHEDHGPVFSTVYFYGSKGKKKKYYRFRTVKCGHTYTLFSNDSDSFIEKYTRTGFFLEKTSLALLPIYFSLLNGNLTLIGLKRIPWSERKYISESYKELYSYEKPGILNLENALRRLKVDSETADRIYMQSRSIFFDCEVLFFVVKNGFLHPVVNNNEDKDISKSS